MASTGLTGYPCVASATLTHAMLLFAIKHGVPPQEYIALLKTVFDFPRIKDLLARPDFTFVFDGMHGVAGAYASRVFVDELGASKESLLR